MELGLSGKVAVVTGASKGIGLAVTNALAREGVCVAAGARDITEELTMLAASSQVHPVSVDLTKPDGPTWFPAVSSGLSNVRPHHPQQLREVGSRRLSYSSWRRHQKPVSLRPSGARSSHWYMPQRTSIPRSYAE
jgi:hypothetical protein